MQEDRVRAFVARHPDALVLDLRCGLGGRFYRIGGVPPSEDWYNVDLPGIMAVRDDILPENPRAHSVPVSLADKRWPEAIPGDRPTMLVADELFAFLAEQMIVELFGR